MSQHFLTVPLVLADRSYHGQRRAFLDAGASPADAHSQAREQIRGYLFGLYLTLDDVDTIFAAIAEIERAARRRVRLPFGRALALVQAPIDFLASAQASGPVMFVRSVGYIPAGVHVERFRVASRPVVRPLPLP